LIDTITRTFEVFRIPNTILMDTPIAKRLGCEHVPLAKPIGTTCEKPIDDLTASVKHVIHGD
jgi:hypothetical protein